MANSKRLLFFLILSFGIFCRLYVGLKFQGRLWIDEVWVVLNPAYKLLTGVGHLAPDDFGTRIRSWIAPTLLFFYLKILGFLKITEGPTVLPIVRVTFSLLNAAALFIYTLWLRKEFKLKALPFLPLILLFLNPEFIHYSMSMDLNVLGTAPLLVGLSLSLWDKKTMSSKTIVGFILLAFSATIRFQYAFFPIALTISYLVEKDYKHLRVLLAAGIGVFLFHFCFDSWMYGRLSLPIFGYYYTNAVQGTMNTQGTTPFYQAFELLWRVMSEPVFLLALVTVAIAYRTTRFIALATILFFAIHAATGNKQLRYFYGIAVLFSGLAGASLQKWTETDRRNRVMAVAMAVTCFLAVAAWRAESKVRWGDYQIPSRLETRAGAQPDIRGLLTYGWSGIYCGGQYSFFRPLPYECAETRTEYAGRKIEAENFNYIVTVASAPPPCKQRIAEDEGGALYHCSLSEIAAVISAR